NGGAAAAGGLAATFLAYVIGGYAAGRVARFNGGRNGLGVVLWTLIVAVLAGIAGVVLELGFPAVARTVHLNTLAVSLRAEAVNVAIVAVPALVVMIVAGPLGGALGTRYHRRVDRAMGVPAL
ncbi:MAG: hypothetical protein J2P38_01495, partial [Candidatus Dormibacteraeota bacterium]|nr:hypothetical protein [Candidatus Dormibacteraeota bacterium]